MNFFHTVNKARRQGSSYLEVQVAMVMLAVGMTGLYSMTVVQTRQANRLRDMLPAADLAALNQAPTTWQRKLGVYASIDDVVVAANPVLPDAAVEVVVDNDDGTPAFKTHKHPSDSSGWTNWTHAASYGGKTHYHQSNNNVGSWCEFQTSGLPPGNYEVLLTYREFGNIGNAVPHEVFDGSTLLGTVAVNQRTPTTGISHGGRLFDSLGVYAINSGQLRVRVVDGPGCSTYIIADAILIRSRRILNVISVDQTANGGATAVLETVP